MPWIHQGLVGFASEVPVVIFWAKWVVPLQVCLAHTCPRCSITGFVWICLQDLLPDKFGSCSNWTQYQRLIWSDKGRNIFHNPCHVLCPVIPRHSRVEELGQTCPTDGYYIPLNWIPFPWFFLSWMRIPIFQIIACTPVPLTMYVYITHVYFLAQESPVNLDSTFFTVFGTGIRDAPKLHRSYSFGSNESTYQIMFASSRFSNFDHLWKLHGKVLQWPCWSFFLEENFQPPHFETGKKRQRLVDL